MSATPDSSNPGHVPIAGTQLGHQPCVSCAYNLDGLSIDRLCPECGTPIARSVQGDLLRFASRRHIGNLLRGARLLVCAGVITLLHSAAALIAGAIFGYFTIGRATHRSTPISRIAPQYIIESVEAASSLIVVGNSILALIGYFLITDPHPQTQTREERFSARRVVRGAVIAQLVAALGTSILSLLNLAQVNFTGPLQNILQLELLFQLLILAAWGTAFFAWLLYLRRIAHRIPDQVLVDRSRRFLWLLPLLIFPGALFFLIGPFVAAYIYLSTLLRLVSQLRGLHNQATR